MDHALAVVVAELGLAVPVREPHRFARGRGQEAVRQVATVDAERPQREILERCARARVLDLGVGRAREERGRPEPEVEPDEGEGDGRGAVAPPAGHASPRPGDTERGPAGERPHERHEEGDRERLDAVHVIEVARDPEVRREQVRGPERECHDEQRHRA